MSNSFLIPLTARVKITLLLLVLLVCGVTVVVLINRDQVGNTVWRKLHWAKMAVLLSENDSALKESIGSYYFNGGAYDLDKAKKYYADLLSVDDYRKIAAYQLARIAFVQGDLVTAKKLLNQNLEQYPDWKQSHYVRGLVNVYRGDFEAAVEDFEIFVAWKPEEWGGYNDLAWAYLKAGEYEKAWKITEKGIQRFPENLWLNNSAGVALWNMGELPEAEEFFERAKLSAQKATVTTWRAAYLGNDPTSYSDSLEKMREVINRNLEGVRAELQEK